MQTNAGRLGKPSPRATSPETVGRQNRVIRHQTATPSRRRLRSGIGGIPLKA